MSTSFAFGQTEFNNFELNYKGGYSATPVEIIPLGATTDTIRMGEANGYEFGGAAYLNCGLGAEFTYSSHNRYFDTLAGNGTSYSIGLAFRKAGFGPGSLFDAGFNSAFKIGAGYIHAEKTDQIEYINTEGSRIWTREKSFSGFYADVKLDIFRDNPFESSDFFFFGASLSAGVKYPMMNKLSESSDGEIINGSWNKEDSVSIVNVGLEIKPVIIPINNRMGVSLITGISYGNFNSYNVHSPGVNFKVGLSLDGFIRFGECARVTYTRVSRDNYVSNEISFGVEVIKLCRTLFVR
ncbi:MAG: hypothetical protein WCJ57_01060 [Candidatus Falkowbacteria bacterium]